MKYFIKDLIGWGIIIFAILGWIMFVSKLVLIVFSL